MHSPSSCRRTAWGYSPSLGVKDPISSQSQKNEGCCLKWFPLSWEGEVRFYLRGGSLRKLNSGESHTPGRLVAGYWRRHWWNADLWGTVQPPLPADVPCLTAVCQCPDLHNGENKTFIHTLKRSTAHNRGQLIHTLTLKQFISVVLCFPTKKQST